MVLGAAEFDRGQRRGLNWAAALEIVGSYVWGPLPHGRGSLPRCHESPLPDPDVSRCSWGLRHAGPPALSVETDRLPPEGYEAGR
jgi:hypothetical protein